MKHVVGYVFPCLMLLAACTSPEPELYEVHRGDFRQTLTETGELQTADTKSYVMPRFGRYWNGFKITGMLDHGCEVHPGDSLLQFDPQDVQRFIVDQETRLENQQAILEKLLINNAIEEKSQQNTLKGLEASMNLNRLQLESARFETEKNQKIKQLQFRQSEINYRKALKNIDYAKVQSACNVKIQQIYVDQARRQLEMGRAVLPKLTIRATSSGIFQVSRKRRGRGPMLKVGDEVYAGNSLCSIPDMTWMKVKTTVNEVDRAKLMAGQPVTVRMDALPSVPFRAEVEKVGLLCHRFSDTDARKVFDVTVKLLVSDQRMKPGMTVSCEFLCDDLHDVFYVPSECLWRQNGRYFLNLAHGGAQPVRLVSHNNRWSVVEGDIYEGQKILPVTDKTE